MESRGNAYIMIEEVNSYHNVCKKSGYMALIKNNRKDAILKTAEIIMRDRACFKTMAIWYLYRYYDFF